MLMEGLMLSGSGLVGTMRSFRCTGPPARPQLPSLRESGYRTAKLTWSKALARNQNCTK